MNALSIRVGIRVSKEPFGNLDQPRTKAAAEAQGLRFIIRDKPLQQWLDHRAQHEDSGAKSWKN